MVERVTVSLPRLPAAFDGFTIAVIADLHAGRKRGGVAAIQEILGAANRLMPDVIALLGDIVHAPLQAERWLSFLSGLQPGQATFACLGNHEHGFVWFSRYLGARPSPSVDHWRRLYAQVGAQLLVNEAVATERGGERIWMVGVDDTYSGRDDLPTALRGVPSNEFCLAITHSPDIVDHARAGELDLVLASHTHGGQVCLPFLGPVWAPCRKPRARAAGLVRANGTTMYVTRGVGEGLPIRLACPRQLPLITLRRAEQR